MSSPSSLALLRVPSFVLVTGAILLTILAEAVAGSYMVLLAVEKIGMSPLELSIYLTTAAASAIAVTFAFGNLHDSRPSLWPLLITLVAKIVGFALCIFVADTWALVVIGLTLFGLGSASFPLLFAIAKGTLDEAGGELPARGMASLRMTSSLGWAIGPVIGALSVALWGLTGVFIAATALAIVALVVVIVGRIAPRTGVPPQPRITADEIRIAAPIVVALTAFHTAMFMGSNATSIVVVRGLGAQTDVGLLHSLCAAIEVVIMAGFVVRPALSFSLPLLILGFALFAAYFGLVLAVPTLASFYFGQIVRAVAIGIVSIIGMARLQQVLPSRAGVAAALYGNSMSAGALVSGLATGLWANSFGYHSIFWACGALSVVGAVAVMLPVRAVATAR